MYKIYRAYISLRNECLPPLGRHLPFTLDVMALREEF